jgi:hypothetical protein
VTFTSAEEEPLAAQDWRADTPGTEGESRAKMLGPNAARLFGLSVPNGKGPA